MNTIVENASLKAYNTFGINVTARYFASFSSLDELAGLMEDAYSPLILGGGSNILLMENIDGWVLRNAIPGVELVHEDEEYVYVKAGAGGNWHRFVEYCLRRNWAGVENLSLIPGSVGAAPMQNIGAYGVEIKDVFYELEAWNLREKRVEPFSLNDCAFGYRESVFKRKYRDRFVILNVTFQLRKKPLFHTGYGAIREELDRMGVGELSIQTISQAVIRIRQSKLPDPAEIGNAGSFFKNPSVPDGQFARLRAEFPGIIGYPNSRPGYAGATGVAGAGGTEGETKLAAGWLIEQCGWKGYRRGNVGCHARQALVLVNYGNATGKEVYELSEEILQSVLKKFGITLEREVNCLPLYYG